MSRSDRCRALQWMFWVWEKLKRGLGREFWISCRKQHCMMSLKKCFLWTKMLSEAPLPVTSHGSMNMTLKVTDNHQNCFLWLSWCGPLRFILLSQTVPKEYYVWRKTFVAKGQNCWETTLVSLRRQRIDKHTHTQTHTSHLVRNYLNKNNAHTVLQTPCSPEMAPCNVLQIGMCVLFAMKFILKGIKGLSNNNWNVFVLLKIFGYIWLVQ